MFHSSFPGLWKTSWSPSGAIIGAERPIPTSLLRKPPNFNLETVTRAEFFQARARRFLGAGGDAQDSKSCNETGVALGSPENKGFTPGFRNLAKTVYGMVT
jgi:hypothetical protein